MKSDMWTIVERAKERHALDVIPVKVGDEDMGTERSIAELALQRVAEHTESRAAVEDVNLVCDAHFYA